MVERMPKISINQVIVNKLSYYYSEYKKEARYIYLGKFIYKALIKEMFPDNKWSEMCLDKFKDVLIVRVKTIKSFCEVGGDSDGK
jgi:hypothetical protein